MIVFKRSLQICLINNILKRNIAMSAQRRAEDALNSLREQNPYYEKYAEKIAKLQKTSPEDLLNRLEQVKVKSEKPKNLGRTYSELLNPKEKLEEKSGETPYKKLADIMKLGLIADKTGEEITKIWMEYHKTKDVLVATLTVDQYNKLMENAKQYPIFLLPLPRSEGFEFVLLQFAANTVHFTPLIAYQVHGENAPECLTLVHYKETEDKGVVLMRGEYDSKVLNGQEAQCLANELQMFYCKPDPDKVKLLEMFTKKPDEFKHMELIKQVENITLG